MVSPNGSSVKGKGRIMLQANRAYSTDFAAHRDLICKLAQKGWGRLQQAGVVMDFEDVFQEMSVIYCKAAEGYDPSRGFTFTAYLGRAIWQDFNKFAERLINDQCGLGLVRIEEVGDEELDFYDMMPSDEMTPEEACISSRSFMDNMKSLPKMEREIVGRLMKQVIRPRQGEAREEMSLSEIMHAMSLTRTQATAARKRIGQVFGVDLKGCK